MMSATSSAHRQALWLRSADIQTLPSDLRVSLWNLFRMSGNQIAAMQVWEIRLWDKLVIHQDKGQSAVPMLSTSKRESTRDFNLVLINSVSSFSQLYSTVSSMEQETLFLQFLVGSKWVLTSAVRNFFKEITRWMDHVSFKKRLLLLNWFSTIPSARL